MDWNAQYQSGDTPWDKGEAAPPLREFLSQSAILGKVLVPGCGVGHDCRLLASHGAEVLGLDIAPLAIQSARSFENVGGENYAIDDFFALPSRFLHQFDWVFEHTCFCAIAPAQRAQYVQACLQALKADGLLLAIFFRNPDHASDGPPYGCSTHELDSLFGPFFTLQAEWHPTQAYPGREGRELVRLYRKSGAPKSEQSA